MNGLVGSGYSLGWIVSLELVLPSLSNVGIIYYLLFVPINAHIYILKC